VRVLRRILRALCAAFCAALVRRGCRAGKVFVGYLEVVLAGDDFTIPQPRADNVRREAFGQFRLSGTSQVVKQPGPYG
jgi:hypothetical protein